MSVSIEYDAENLDTVRPLEIMLFMPVGSSGSYTSLKGINEKAPLFFTFLSHLEDVRYRRSPQKYIDCD